MEDEVNVRQTICCIDCCGVKNQERLKMRYGRIVHGENLLQILVQLYKGLIKQKNRNLPSPPKQRTSIESLENPAILVLE